MEASLEIRAVIVSVAIGPQHIDRPCLNIRVGAAYTELGYRPRINTELNKSHEPEAPLAEHFNHDGGVRFRVRVVARIGNSLHEMLKGKRKAIGAPNGGQHTHDLRVALHG